MTKGSVEKLMQEALSFALDCQMAMIKAQVEPMIHFAMRGSKERKELTELVKNITRQYPRLRAKAQKISLFEDPISYVAPQEARRNENHA
ncbi:hypothetical protein ES702_07397 [subsurface metagenome]